MKYFAYGSNMSTYRLRKRVPSCQFYSRAVLKAYKLTFHKRSKDGSGKCHALYTGDSQDRIIGIVFDICDAEKEALDTFEGLGKGKGYSGGMVALDLDTDSGNESITAYTYIAQPDYSDDTLKPYTWYKALVVAGAREHDLPDEYIEQIEAVAAQEDPDKTREQENRSLLLCQIEPSISSLR